MFLDVKSNTKHNKLHLLLMCLTLGLLSRSTHHLTINITRQSQSSCSDGKLTLNLMKAHTFYEGKLNLYVGKIMNIMSFNSFEGIMVENLPGNEG